MRLQHFGSGGIGVVTNLSEESGERIAISAHHSQDSISSEGMPATLKHYCYAP